MKLNDTRGVLEDTAPSTKVGQLHIFMADGRREASTTFNEVGRDLPLGDHDLYAYAVRACPPCVGDCMTPGQRCPKGSFPNWSPPDGVSEAGHQVNAPASTDASSPAVRKAEDKLTESGSCIAARTALKESDQ